VSKICKPPQNSRRQRVTRNIFHTKDAQTLDATLQNVFDRTTRRPGSLRPCSNIPCYREDQGADRSLSRIRRVCRSDMYNRNLVPDFSLFEYKYMSLPFRTLSPSEVLTLCAHCYVTVMCGSVQSLHRGVTMHSSSSFDGVCRHH
jgi:hypothetical protein